MSGGVEKCLRCGFSRPSHDVGAATFTNPSGTFDCPEFVPHASLATSTANAVLADLIRFLSGGQAK